jgi:RecG-like helicase
MTVEYKLSSDAPRSIIIEGEGSFAPFVEYMEGKIIETFDGDLCEIPFTPENATKLRMFLRGKEYEIPPRERAILKYLADNPDALEDKEIRWTTKLTDFQANLLPKKYAKIKTEWDLIHYLPLRYLDKSNPQSVDELILGQWAVIGGTVVSVEPNYQHDFVKIVVADVKNQRIAATFFRQKWLGFQYKEGDEVVVYGNYSEYVNKKTQRRYPQITNPKIDKIKSYQTQGYGMVPIYPQKSEDKSWALKIAQETLLSKIVWIEDPVPLPILTKYNLMSRTDAYKKIHFPDTREDVEGARRRIAFDEYVRLQVFIANNRENLGGSVSGAKRETKWADAFTSSLPFEFTNAQKRVITEILSDLSSNTPMYRLLQGDVGSGKALPLDALVLTPAGYKKMGAMKVGETVVTPNGGITTVTHFFPQGKRPIYKLVFSDGTSARADQDHLWKVQEKLNGETDLLASRLMTTKDLINNGLTVYGGQEPKWHIPQPNMNLISSYVPKTENHKVSGETKSIVSITFEGQELAACIKLLDSEGLFITNDYTVTHNTEISSVATLSAVESGYQVALLAPTDILATQLYERLTATFRKAGITESQLKLGLFNGRVLGKKRAKLLEELKDGTINVIVGTHALSQKYVEFHNLGLAIVDEQHKFGSEQRSALRKINPDGSTPDMLAMSATPIPRTTSQIIYGDMDISIVDELPAERIPIKTEWHENSPEQAWVKIREEVEKGHQAYIVTALVDESESERMADVESAVQTHADLQNNVFPEMTIGLLHGKLSRDEKAEVIDKFYKNEIQVLVATTVVEVGVNVPNATVMTILNANRFGIASLHQIRGRVGRGAIESFCYLVGEATVPEAEERLNALVSSNDGFWLAEKDLEIRGEGSLFGRLQSGDSDLYVGNLKEHKDLLEVTKNVAKQAKKSVLLNAEVKMLYKDKKILA